MGTEPTPVDGVTTLVSEVPAVTGGSDTAFTDENVRADNSGGSTDDEGEDSSLAGGTIGYDERDDVRTKNPLAFTGETESDFEEGNEI